MTESVGGDCANPRHSFIFPRIVVCHCDRDGIDVGCENGRSPQPRHCDRQNARATAEIEYPAKAMPFGEVRNQRETESGRFMMSRAECKACFDAQRDNARRKHAAIM